MQFVVGLAQHGILGSLRLETCILVFWEVFLVSSSLRAKSVAVLPCGSSQTQQTSLFLALSIVGSSPDSCKP